MRYTAIVPARKGSTRLAGKNMLDLAGKPLVQWTIKAALASKKIEHVVVTSDDDRVLSLAKEMGVGTIRRPDRLADNTATTYSAVEHALYEMDVLPEFTILLQPTSPLRFATHIDEAIDLLEMKGADGIVSVTETEHSPLWSNTLPPDGHMKGFLRKEILNKRGQDLPRYYRLNGAIYILDTEVLLREKSFFPDQGVYAYIMDRTSSIDIDDRIDFLMAEILLEELKGKTNGIH